jgi:8-oxo-dGTP diphosphatase
VAEAEQPARHSVSVAAAILDDQERFLVIRRADNGRWEPPGGVLELHESIADGLAREVREETGLDIRPLALTGIYKNMHRAIVALVFRCDIIRGTPTTSDETCQLAWIASDELDAYMPNAYGIRLLDALDDDALPHVRAHDGSNIIT